MEGNVADRRNNEAYPDLKTTIINVSTIYTYIAPLTYIPRISTIACTQIFISVAEKYFKIRYLVSICL